MYSLRHCFCYRQASESMLRTRYRPPNEVINDEVSSRTCSDFDVISRNQDPLLAVSCYLSFNLNDGLKKYIANCMPVIFSTLS